MSQKSYSKDNVSLIEHNRAAVSPKITFRDNKVSSPHTNKIVKPQMILFPPKSKIRVSRKNLHRYKLRLMKTIKFVLIKY